MRQNATLWVNGLHEEIMGSTILKAFPDIVINLTRMTCSV